MIYKCNIGVTIVKILRVDDDVHDIIKTMAAYEDRTIGAFLNRFFREARDGRRNDGLWSLWYSDGSIREDKVPSETTPLTEKPQVVNPAVADLLRNGDLKPGTTVAYTGKPSEPDFSANELECCQHPSRPCKHWVWDTDSGEGYRNTLSGRFREAD